jgi:rhodanese-related sulfurtransferase
MTQVPTATVDGVPEPLPHGVVVLDVREPEEWTAGHIDGALHIPLGTLPVRLDEVPADATVLVVCRSGGRSAQATMWLEHQGREAVNLHGGMHAWMVAGRPMVSETGQPPEVA